MPDVVKVLVSGAAGPIGLDIQTPVADRAGRMLQLVAGGNGRRAVAVAGATPANAIAATDAAAPTGSLLVGHGEATVGDTIVKTLAELGVPTTSGVVPIQKLQAAIDDAAQMATEAGGVGVRLHADPDAIYRKDGPLTLNGQHLDLRGAGFRSMSDGDNAVVMTGAGGSLRNGSNLGGAQARTAVDQQNGLYVVDASDFQIENFSVGQVATGYGHAAAGVLFRRAKRGVTRGLRSAYSWADGIHHTDACEDITHYSPVSVSCGDDGIAVVSYRADKSICRRITTHDAKIEGARGRGLGLVGGEGLFHFRPKIMGTSAAAVLVQSEASYDTLGVREWGIIDFYAEGCVTGIGLDAGFRHPVLLLSGRSGSQALNDGTTATLQVLDGQLTGRVAGMGASGYAAIDANSVDVVRLFRNLKLENITGPAAGNAACVLGDTDGSGSMVIDGAAGIPFFFAQTTGGDHHYDRLAAINARQSAPSITDQIHFDGAFAGSSMHIDLGVFTDPSGSHIGGLGGDAAKVTYRRLALNGQALSHS